MEPHDETGAGDQRPEPVSEPGPEHRPDVAAEQPATPAAAAPAARPPVGNESVAAALEELSTVGQRPLAEHPDAYARVHAGLQQALSDIDDA